MLRNNLFRVTGVVFILLLLSACGSGGGDAPADTGDTVVPTVDALYSTASNWNDYVKTTDTATACDGSETGGYSACIHGGEMRSVEVPGKSDCTGLTATDALGAFDWTCDASTNPVRMVSSGLRDIAAVTDTTDGTSVGQLVNSTASFVTDGVAEGDTVINTTDYTTTTVTSIDNETRLTLADDIFVSGESYSINRDKNLSDLIDFATPGWKNNTVTVLDGATKLFSTASSAWWSNPVVIDNDGGSLLTSGTVYLVTTDPNSNYILDASNIALVVKPGVTLTGSGGGKDNIWVDTKNFLWLEGKLEATGQEQGIFLDFIKFSVLRTVEVNNADYNLWFSDSSNNLLRNVIANNNTYVGMTNGIYMNRADYNTLENVITAGNPDGITLEDSSNNNTLTNIATVNNSRYGIWISGSSDNRLSNISASNNDFGVYLQSSSNNNRLSNLTTSDNGQYGLYLLQSKNNTLENITAVSNGAGGVNFNNDSINNSLVNATASNNVSSGISFANSSNRNSLSNITASNNGYAGISFWTTSNNNSLSNITAANNGSTGVALQSSSDNSLSNITTVNNLLYGIILQSSSNNSLSNVSAANNGNNGVRIANSADNSLLNVATANNINYGVVLATATNTYISGLLKVGNHPLDDCLDTGGDTFSDANCTAVAPSDFTLTQSVTLASSFIGKIMTDDILNTSDTSGGASYPADPAIFDWTSFDNNYRGWGKDAAFPGSASRGLWTTGTGHIWDWSADINDTVIKDVLIVPDGNATITHTWSDASSTIYLRNAIEIADGNDNGLCESGETCMFTPNIGSYQGHGALQSAGTFTDGSITGVTLIEYDTNGY